MYTESPPRTPVPASVSAQHMVHLLESLLPQGNHSAQQGQGLTDKSGPAPSAELLFEHGGRAAEIAVKLGRFSVPVPSQFLECPDTAYHPHSRCTRAVLSGGATLVQDQSPKYQDKPSGEQLLTVLLTYEDGKQVFVSEAGGSGEGKGEGEGEGKSDAGKTALPLTFDQLTAVANSPVWKPVLAMMPAPSEGPRVASVPRMTGQHITHVIEKLLPAGLNAAHEGGAEGFGHVVVDDGNGESLVAVNVQRWRPHDPSMRKLFEGADTLPDGTRISIRRGPASGGGEGAVAWTADTLRTDGLRVVVSAVNARAYRLPAGRGEPALKVEQLKQMALDEAWRTASR
ncbi:hypothetical protein [Streptomyces sp. NBC_01294]|uniref:hypothetical protein n=1 Tax=Streptomyces sp. NBC_01294 TaxID=2903815 RepID=UPI002DDB4380|nr:hypothetical protein [Streptomyces sp. NBC_01294]WRZ61058.1 hypothetical protein OG534_33905 [Streptomyces sp. NBC_01294]